MKPLIILWHLVVRNWKTSFAGLLALGWGWLGRHGVEVSTATQAEVLAFIVAALGFLSKDGDAPTPQTPEL